MTDEPKRIATAAAALDDPYAALNQHLHGDGDVPPLRITYRNWRGEVGERNIIPQSVWFGATDWHPEPQWLLSALDTDKGATRDFALADFGAGRPDRDEIDRLAAENARLRAERDAAWQAGAEAMRAASASAALNVHNARIRGCRMGEDWVNGHGIGSYDAYDAIRALPLPAQPKEGEN